MAKLKRYNNDEFSGIGGLKLFIKCKKYWGKVKPIFDKYNLYHNPNIQNEYITMIEKATGKTIDEIMNR